MHTKRNGFTMIELVFVIVVLGILAAIALPKFTATRTDAIIAKGRSDVASIRSAILSERQSRIIKGDYAWVSGLSKDSTTLFTGPDSNHSLLMYGIKSSTKEGHWSTSDSAKPYKNYTYKIGSNNCNFVYDSSKGTFTLKANQPQICNELVK